MIQYLETVKVIIMHAIDVGRWSWVHPGIVTDLQFITDTFHKKILVRESSFLLKFLSVHYIRGFRNYASLLKTLFCLDFIIQQGEAHKACRKAPYSTSRGKIDFKNYMLRHVIFKNMYGFKTIQNQLTVTCKKQNNFAMSFKLVNGVNNSEPFRFAVVSRVKENEWENTSE